MSKPTILTVDDDPPVSAAITRDLRRRYGADYRIVRATSGAEALDVLAELALRGQPVALIAADQRMPRMTGIELLAQARAHAPGAKLPAAHGVRRHRRRDHGDQRHRPRLLPAQAVGPARGAALPRRRRPARRLAAGEPRPHLRRAGGRPPVVRPQPRHQDVPGPQPRAVPVVRRRARRGGPAAARPGAHATRPTSRSCSSPTASTLRSPSTLRARRRARPAHHRPAAAVRRVHRRAADRPGWPPPCTPRRRA